MRKETMFLASLVQIAMVFLLSNVDAAVAQNMQHLLEMTPSFKDVLHLNPDFDAQFNIVLRMVASNHKGEL